MPLPLDGVPVSINQWSLVPCLLLGVVDVEYFLCRLYYAHVVLLLPIHEFFCIISDVLVIAGGLEHVLELGHKVALVVNDHLLLLGG